MVRASHISTVSATRPLAGRISNWVRFKQRFRIAATLSQDPLLQKSHHVALDAFAQEVESAIEFTITFPCAFTAESVVSDSCALAHRSMVVDQANSIREEIAGIVASVHCANANVSTLTARAARLCRAFKKRCGS